MRVLVTGHRGYLGTLLVPLLRADQHEVAGLDSGLFDDCSFGADGSAAHFPEVRADVREIGPDNLVGFDAVVHLAGLSNDPLGDFDPRLTDDINHRAAVRLARLARDAGVARFVFASTCSVYGAAGDDMVGEHAPLRPVTPYARSKALAEEGIAALASPSFSPVLLRSATAYGVSPRLRFDLVLNNFVAWALTTGRVLLRSDGSPWRPLVHAEDIARAFCAALSAPRQAVHGEVFNVGRNDENYRVREMAEVVAAVVPDCRIEYAPGAGPDRRCYRVDFGKIVRELTAFVPRWTIRAGVRELYDACRKVGVRAGEFEDARYNRIEHVRQLLRSGRIDGDLRWL